jgi:hypothetical protein
MITVPTSSAGARFSRRLSTRRHVVLACQAVRERDFRLVADQTLDVSVDGLLLPIRTPLTIGESLIVSFQIPGTWIDAEAVVTRVIHGRRPSDEGLAAGLVFDVISASSRAALAGFLHGRPPPLPRRGPLARLRRGEPAPRLADHASMAALTASAAPDIVDVDDVAEDVGPEDGAVDVPSLLCALVGAWRELAAQAERG